VFATYGFLTLAVLALWFGADTRAPAVRRFAWAAFLLAAIIAGLVSGFVRPIALVWIAALGGATWMFSRPDASRVQRLVAAAAIVLLSAGLMAHQLPGFNNPRVLSDVRFSADAVPFRLYLNFDKTVAGLLLLAFCHERIARAADWRAMLRRAAPAALGTIAVLLLLSLASGYVRFDPKFPAAAWLWLWVNLCFTCMAEEALFRGFVQAQLQRAWQRLPRGEWLALAVAAILFGFAHVAGGAAYVALSIVAGIGYGWVYLRTGRIEASILTHFALNALHFFGFTYPAVERIT
jgi:hypothetical protein